MVLLALTTSCQSGQQESQEPKPPISPLISQKENLFIFNDLTLEQADSQGTTQWKLKADRVIYSSDRQTARLEKVTGNLYQDGKIVLKVSAKQGKIEQNGAIVHLEEQIVAIDQRNGVVIRCEQAEWRPQEGLLLAQKNLQGTHSQVEATAGEGKYLTRQQQLELIGEIIAQGKQEPWQLRTEHLIWYVSQAKIIGDRPLQIDRYEEKIVVDRLEAERGEVDLKQNIVYLRRNIELKSSQPPLQIATNAASWELNTRNINTQQPVQIVHHQEKIKVTANRGKLALDQQIAYLQGGVKGESQSQQATLYANELTWNIKNQTVEAQDNVIYQQLEPQLLTTGSQARGNLRDNNITVISSNGKKVVTEIIPD